MKTWLKFALGGIGLAAIVGVFYLFNRSTAKTELLKYIPNEAYLVGKINFAAFGKIIRELNEQDLKLLKDSKSENDKAARILIRQFSMFFEPNEKTGIDLSASGWYFMETTARGDGMAFIFNINSEEKFAEYVNKKSLLGMEKGEVNGVKYVEQGKGVFISWYNGVAMISSHPGEGKDYTELVLLHKRMGSEKNTLVQEMIPDFAQMLVLVKLEQWNEKMPNDALAFIRDITDLNKLSILAEFEFKEGELQVKTQLRSTDKAQLKDLEITKNTGWTSAMVLMNSKKDLHPALRVAASFDLQKFLALTRKKEAEGLDGLMKLPFVKESSEALTGEIYYAEYHSGSGKKLHLQLGTKLNAHGNRTLLTNFTNALPGGVWTWSPDQIKVEDMRISLDETGVLESSTGTYEEQILVKNNSPIFISMAIKEQFASGPTGHNYNPLQFVDPGLVGYGDLLKMNFIVYSSAKNENFLVTFMKTLSGLEKKAQLESDPIQ